jgi:Aminopeptidase P, N-terminal domain
MKLNQNQQVLSYKYRQDSDFWYLTGFEEPNSAVTLGTVTVIVALSASQLT